MDSKPGLRGLTIKILNLLTLTDILPDDLVLTYKIQDEEEDLQTAIKCMLLRRQGLRESFLKIAFAKRDTYYSLSMYCRTI